MMTMTASVQSREGTLCSLRTNDTSSQSHYNLITKLGNASDIIKILRLVRHSQYNSVVARISYNDNYTGVLGMVSGQFLWAQEVDFCHALANFNH